MKWTYNLPGKLKISLILTFLLIVILITTINQRSISREIKSAMVSMFEDRLITKSYILQLSDELHYIKWILKENPKEKNTYLDFHLNKIEHLSLKYLDTELTNQEKQHFEIFENLTWDMRLQIKNNNNVDYLINSSLEELKILTKIQVEEAQHLLIQSKKSFSFINIQSQLEVILIIITALLFRTILLDSKTINIPLDSRKF